ncbi:hypothetical protein QFZ33_002411 [Arthrobacter globiformis]|nr:hypothetical protein [Arthrobacter globiformis]
MTGGSRHAATWRADGHGKIEEWIEASKGRIRADRAHEKLLALGYMGSERSTRRTIAQVKAAWRLGHTRVHRPWITEPGMWLQYDFGDGPRIGGVKTILFVAWLAFSRFRIVIPLRDRTAPSVFAALDRCFRILGGAPTYVLTESLSTYLCKWSKSFLGQVGFESFGVGDAQDSQGLDPAGGG